jgi:PIN domain nuclease of toxin-antitoxin system
MPDAAQNAILLDTHAWLWLMTGAADRFSQESRDLIEAAALSGAVLIPAIAVWEVAMQDAEGRITLDSPCDLWVERALAAPGVKLVPLSPRIAVDSTRLPGSFQGDPADRMVVATARATQATLLSCDGRFSSTRSWGMYGRELCNCFGFECSASRGLRGLPAFQPANMAKAGWAYSTFHRACNSRRRKMECICAPGFFSLMMVGHPPLVHLAGMLGIVLAGGRRQRGLRAAHDVEDDGAGGEEHNDRRHAGHPGINTAPLTPDPDKGTEGRQGQRGAQNTDDQRRLLAEIAIQSTHSTSST